MNCFNVKTAALLALLVPAFCFGKLPEGRYYDALAKAQTMRPNYFKMLADQAMPRLQQLKAEVTALERSLPVVPYEKLQTENPAELEQADKEVTTAEANRSVLENLLRAKQTEFEQALVGLENLIHQGEQPGAERVM